MCFVVNSLNLDCKLFIATGEFNFATSFSIWDSLNPDKIKQFNNGTENWLGVLEKLTKSISSNNRYSGVGFQNDFMAYSPKIFGQVN